MRIYKFIKGSEVGIKIKLFHNSYDKMNGLLLFFFHPPVLLCTYFHACNFLRRSPRKKYNRCVNTYYLAALSHKLIFFAFCISNTICYF